MQWMRLFLTFIANVLLISFGWIMSANGFVDGGTIASVMVIAALMTMIMWFIWNYKLVLQRDEMRATAIQKRKNQEVDSLSAADVRELQQRLERLEMEQASRQLHDEDSEYDYAEIGQIMKRK